MIEISNGEFAYTTDGRQIVGTGHHPQQSRACSIPDGRAESCPTTRAATTQTTRGRWVCSGSSYAFLAMLGIFCSTFLSFPVASMMTFGDFLDGREFGVHPRLAIDNYATLNDDGGLNSAEAADLGTIAFTRVSWIFKTYAELSPVERLVNGQVVGGVTASKRASRMVGLIWCASAVRCQCSGVSQT